MVTPIESPSKPTHQLEMFGLLQVDSSASLNHSTENNLQVVTNVDEIVEEMVKRAELSQSSQTSLVPASSEKPADLDGPSPT